MSGPQPVLLATVLVGLVLALVVASARVVPRSTAGVVLRRGRHHRTVGPDVRLVVPLLERCAVVDLREVVVRLRPGRVTTAEGQSVGVTGEVRYRVVDPARAQAVTDLVEAVTGHAESTVSRSARRMDRPRALRAADLLGAELLAELRRAVPVLGLEATASVVEVVDVHGPARDAG